MAPGKPSERSFEHLVELMDTRTLDRQPSYSGFIFTLGFMQGPMETTSEYVSVLRRFAAHYNLENILDDMLRDRLVRGLWDTRPQRRLLAEKDLTFKKAFDLCQAYETAERDAHDIPYRQIELSSDPQGKMDSYEQSPMIR